MDESDEVILALKLPMKIQTKKAIKRALKADVLAVLYYNQDALEKQASSAKEEVKAEIKMYAKEEGQMEGKSLLVRGEKFAVGYTHVDGNPKLDQAKAFKELPKDLLKKCAVLAPVIVENKFKDLVQKKLISKELLARCCSSRAPYDRLVVTSIADLEEYLLKCSDDKGE